jgi:hypothetical protein
MENPANTGCSTQGDFSAPIRRARHDLDTETLASLKDALAGFPGCAVITSHDRWFLDRVATHILAWERGADWFWFEGNFAAYQQDKAARLGGEAARPHRVTYRKLIR